MVEKLYLVVSLAVSSLEDKASRRSYAGCLFQANLLMAPIVFATGQFFSEVVLLTVHSDFFFEQFMIEKKLQKCSYVKSDRKQMLLLNNCYKTVSGHFFTVCIFIFHKTEVQMVLMGLNLNWFKSYGLKCSKTQIFPFQLFCNFVQKHKFASFAFLGFVS